MQDPTRRRVANEMVRVLPAFGRWATAIQDFETPFGRVGFRQVEIMYAVRHGFFPADDVTPTRIAQFFEVQPSVVTRALAKLEASELIVRVSDPADGRRFFVDLTDKGIEASEYIEQLYTQEMFDAIGELEVDDLPQLERMMGLLYRVAEVLDVNRKRRMQQQ